LLFWENAFAISGMACVVSSPLFCSPCLLFWENAFAISGMAWENAFAISGMACVVTFGQFRQLGQEVANAGVWAQ
tara:strand:- start:335 stop:559 length:225 start_codon:yes stop_codon:yes gene_type:complete